MEKCTGGKRPESEPVQNRIFEGWGCGLWRRVEAAKRKAKESKKLQIAYLGSTVSNDGRCEEVRRIQASWMIWRKASGILCDRKLLAKVKGKMYKSVVRPTILYGMKTVAVTERQVGKMEVAELKIMRWAMGVTRKEKKRIRERDCKNCKAGRQTLECKAAALVWTRKKERRLGVDEGVGCQIHRDFNMNC